MAPSAKKRKISHAVEKFHCFSCVTDRASSTFPDYNPSPDCDHLINTCKSCLKKWVESNVESNTFARGGNDGEVFGVKCPQCDGIMRNVNVEIAANKKVYQKFDQLERKHIGDTTPGWRWCLSPWCAEGQVHEPKVPEQPQVPELPKPKRQTRWNNSKKSESEPELTNEPDICVCNKCGAQACVACDRPWHEGETCTEYKVRIKDRVQEEDQAIKMIKSVTKACPGCTKRIEKNGGCPSMICSQCAVNFCWYCETVFTQQGCRCRRR